MSAAIPARASSLAAQRAAGDRIMSAVIWFLFVLSLTVAPVYGTWRVAIGFGLPLAVLMQLFALFRPGHRITRVLAGAVFMAFTALLIHEMHGMIEMHFCVFVLLAFLLFYSDWLPLVVAAGVIAVHHLGFHFLQAAGFGVWVLPHLCGINIVLIHAAFVVFETLLLVFMSLQHQHAAEETGEVVAMLEAVLANGSAKDYANSSEHSSANNKIDLRVQSESSHGPALRFSQFLDALRGLVGQIGRHSGNLAASGSHIDSLAASVLSASDLQKRQVGQVAAAVEQMKAAVAEISSSSQSAAANMTQSRESALEGGLVVREAAAAIQALAEATRQTAATIEGLGRSSESIGKIVDTIGEITGQTNLLALNASIEAARAGEQGRGFAVVASEVRSLAERAAAATQEISGIVAGIQQETASAVRSIRTGAEKVDAGIDAVGRAGGALEEIIAAAEMQNQMIAHIASASTEQAVAAEQIGGNMHEILKMAEQSVRGATRSAQECKNLAELAVDLQKVVGNFEIDKEPAAALSQSPHQALAA